MQKFANSYYFKYYQSTAYFTFLKLIKQNTQLVIVLVLKDFFIAGNILC